MALTYGIITRIIAHYPTLRGAIFLVKKLAIISSIRTSIVSRLALQLATFEGSDEFHHGALNAALRKTTPGSSQGYLHQKSRGNMKTESGLPVCQ